VAWIVTQVGAAFGYPDGKVWGPYAETADVIERRHALRAKGADGIVSRSPGPPCEQLRKDWRKPLKI
jgi:hypothetical protein